MTRVVRKVLVADDNRAIASVVRLNLTRAGYSVTLAANGRIALDLAKGEQFDLIVTDQQMPEMSGSELCRELRGSSAHRDVPIILLTAKRLEMEDSRETQELRISEVFSKPFSPRQLVEAVNDLLAPVAQ